MRRLLGWILPKDMWKDFRLDNRVFIAARQGEYGWRYQWVFANFWEKVKDVYGKDI